MSDSQGVVYTGSELAVARHGGDEGELVLDERFFPVIISTWFGKVWPGAIEHYYAWVDRMLDQAKSECSKVIMVTDVLEVQRPSPKQRRRFAQESDARLEGLERSCASSIIVARNPVILGIVAALVWALRSGIRVSTAGDMETALDRGLTKLDTLGLPRPAGLVPARYQRPVRRRSGSGAGAA